MRNRYTLDPTYLNQLWNTVDDLSFRNGGVSILSNLVDEWLEHVGKRTVGRYKGKLYRAKFTSNAEAWYIMDYCNRAAKSNQSTKRTNYHPYVNAINTWPDLAISDFISYTLVEADANEIMALKLDGEKFEVADLTKDAFEKGFKTLANA